MRSFSPARHVLAGVASLGAVAAVLVAPTAHAAGPLDVAGPSETSREAAPVVLTASSLPTWTRSAAVGVPSKPYPSGTEYGDKVRSAHNGSVVVPADPRPGANVDEVSAWSWTGTGWREVPVQVDERFPYFLANARSDFGFYSGTDQELTYSFAPSAHSTGEEAWKKMFGTCRARYAESVGEVEAAIKAGLVTPGPQETPSSYLGAMKDPVATLDDDDEIALQSRDAGPAAPRTALPPAGTRTGGHTVTVTDPTGTVPTRYLYLFLRPGGSSFTHENGPVRHTRAADADVWIDRGSFDPADPEKVGTSNTGYGANLPGTVCANPDDATTARASSDRFPRDGMTITTPTYRLDATGRWMVRSYRVAEPRKEPKKEKKHDIDPTGVEHGPDLIDRWKGRAFQQSPDSTISFVGFEDEQVNWEANAALLGWRSGAVRTIREVWGADSGTNVTKTETFYRDADVFRYRVRVHPIPSDGLYTSWDYNPDVAAVYYNPQRPGGVPVDGVSDENVGNVDSLPFSQDPKNPTAPAPAYFDACDPTFDVCSALLRPEQVAGRGNAGSAVYTFELVGPTSAANFSAVPYYRDDACLDDGTGDAPVPRPWPGEASTDSRVKQGYVDYWKANGAPADLTYADLKCDPTNTAAPAWQRTPFQGAHASHGIHFFATGDSDNMAAGVPTTEIDGQQWRYAVPMSAPRNASVEYGSNVVAPLVVTAAPL